MAFRRLGFHFCAIPAAFASVFLIDFSWSVAWTLRRTLYFPCSMQAVCTLQFLGVNGGRILL